MSTSNLLRLVNILNDAKFHNGTAIGIELGISRSAVWKQIKKLIGYGVAIESVKNKGYLLAEPLRLLDESYLQTALANKAELTVFETLASTNDYCKKHKPASGIKVCLAEQQTKGKGRLNRQWYSPFAQNIYLSCWYPFQKDISELAGLSLVVSLALVSALKELSLGENLCVKWPNDILYAGNKLSGTLIEIQGETHGASHAIIGIGVNVNMVSATEITQPWTSLQQILGRYIDRNEVCVSLLKYLFAYLAKFDQQGFAAFIQEWMQVDCLSQQSIALKNLDHVVQGQVVGINEQGHLLLRLHDGKVQAFSSGDTSVLKE